MPDTATAAQDFAPALDAEGQLRWGPYNVPWVVTHVEPRPEFSLSVGFVDGVKGIVQMKDFLFSDGAGVFKVLRDPALFEQVFCDNHAVEWPGELDLAPDAMHDRIQHGNGLYIMLPK